MARVRTSIELPTVFTWFYESRRCDGRRAISVHSRLVRATCINCILMIFFGILFYIKMFLKSRKTNIVCERCHDLRLTFITADKCHRWHVIISPMVPPLVKIENLSSVEDKSFGFLFSILQLFSFEVEEGFTLKTSWIILHFLNFIRMGYACALHSSVKCQYLCK